MTTSLTIAPAAVQAVLDTHADLSRDGFGRHWHQAEAFRRSRARLTEAAGLAEIGRATAFLIEHCSPRRTINRRLTSYGLKHKAERFAGGYVSNGSFIVGALLLSYRMRRCEGTPNCCFNIIVRDGGRR